ncbi:DUF86 domain-containing protein [Bhargavaea beijingensis]|uniref:DUF86 domain-containing protein n=1 Tax=Bhargavaea beijingensis TaxID=426756 RepID=A0A1G7F210_9BACL|nr:DUF86 domain-containing protein [Bhargavaea beijingensis]MCW1927615.1 DUF86 domain-containing protein [Bhargavaea beijingensis]RSK24035.1 DUF86 domain-containing protein [Bhargavaea beijingensis]SDE69911.1 Uncharacterized conserved protein YutE, UPF0331/DUF86 family [Bhargavaea beijingensis]
MYFIDRNKVEKTASHMEHLFKVYDSRSDWSGSPAGGLALERIAHNLIESVIDIGNTLIDGFIMRDPGSYEDIIDILLDEKVIETEMEAPLKELIGLRKMIVREFMDVDPAVTERVLTATMPALRRFPDSTRRYLAEELGPVSAFLPEDNE